MLLDGGSNSTGSTGVSILMGSNCGGGTASSVARISSLEGFRTLPDNPSTTLPP